MVHLRYTHFVLQLTAFRVSPALLVCQVEEQVEVRMLIEEQLVHAMQDTQHWHARYEQESTLRRQDHGTAAMKRQRLQLELHTLRELLDRTSSLATPQSSRSGSLCAASRSPDAIATTDCMFYHHNTSTWAIPRLLKVCVWGEGGGRGGSRSPRPKWG